MHTDEHRCREALDALNEVTKRIIGGAYAVGNSLGAGFLEKVYENALAHELGNLLINFGQPKVEVKRLAN